MAMYDRKKPSKAQPLAKSPKDAAMRYAEYSNKHTEEVRERLTNAKSYLPTKKEKKKLRKDYKAVDRYY